MLNDIKSAIDWTGYIYCGFGLHLNLNYIEGWVDVTMPIYVTKTLMKLEHTPPEKVRAPHECTKSIYERTTKILLLYVIKKKEEYNKLSEASCIMSEI